MHGELNRPNRRQILSGALSVVTSMLLPNPVSAQNSEQEAFPRTRLSPDLEMEIDAMSNKFYRSFDLASNEISKPNDEINRFLIDQALKDLYLSSLELGQLGLKIDDPFVGGIIHGSSVLDKIIRNYGGGVFVGDSLGFDDSRREELLSELAISEAEYEYPDAEGQYKKDLVSLYEVQIRGYICGYYGFCGMGG
jgi:hypothetical protein